MSLKRLFNIFFAATVFAIGLVFYFHNTQLIALDLVLIRLPELSVAIYLVGFLVLGIVLGLSSAWLLLWRTRAQLTKALRKIKSLERVG